MAPVSSAIIDPQGSPELGPFELDERIVWAFLRGIDGHMKPKDIANIGRSLGNPNAAARFVAGLAVGAFEGARFTIEEYIKSSIATIEALSNWTLEFYTTVYDPRVLRALVRIYATAPNTLERVAALNDFADTYEEHHPAASAAFRSMAEVFPLLERIAEWLRKPDALASILVALARQLGELIGGELERIRSLTGQVYEQGKELGNMIGQAVMQLALFLLGV